MRRETLILGLGNPLRGDDGLGPRVVAELEREELPAGVAVIDGGTGGLGLLQILEEWERVLVVDAADVGLSPGRYRKFPLEDARLKGNCDTFSVHAAGLSEAIALGAALGHRLAPIVVFGVQPAAMEWVQGLSPEVEAAIPELVDAVLEEAKGDSSVQDPGD